MENHTSHSAEDVKNWFLAWTYNDEKAHIDNLKLQKLLYYAQGYSLAKLDKPMFYDEIFAYPNGPVVKNVQDKLVKGTAPIKLEVDFDFDIFSLEESQILADVWETYGHYESVKLVGKTHKKGSPWKKVRDENSNTNALMSKDMVGQYFMGALYGAFMEEKSLQIA